MDKLTEELLKKLKEHKHHWQFVASTYEYPMGISGTVGAIEYAYLLCQCSEIKKVKVKNDKTN